MDSKILYNLLQQPTKWLLKTMLLPKCICKALNRYLLIYIYIDIYKKIKYALKQHSQNPAVSIVRVYSIVHIYIHCDTGHLHHYTFTGALGCLVNFSAFCLETIQDFIVGTNRLPRRI